VASAGHRSIVRWGLIVAEAAEDRGQTEEHFVVFQASESTPERPERYDKETLQIRIELVDVPESSEDGVDFWVMNAYAARYTGWITAVDTAYHERVEVLD